MKKVYVIIEDRPDYEGGRGPRVYLVKGWHEARRIQAAFMADEGNQREGLLCRVYELGPTPEQYKGE